MDVNMDAEQVTIEWKQFGESFVADLWQFFNSDEYSDVTITTEDGQEIKSHRILLAMCSTYFRDIFKRNKNPGHITVCLSNIRSDVVLKIFALIYGGMVQMTPSSLGEFVKAARFLKLNGFDGINPHIDIDDLVEATEQNTNHKRTFALNLQRVDTPEAPRQPANNVTLDGNIDNVTSTMNVSNEKFFPSSDSDSDV
ncbi:modifier of mdg4-like [Sitodiplosis mosellana]|uniref:modifier of mdg4-like n=1 Tax=Sitodiplosis mosellana TaxID=263140 RepID=UPI0024446D99|nr:modifier of mdg4-like [Sitodiplosis mosellana]